MADVRTIAASPHLTDFPAGTSRTALVLANHHARRVREQLDHALDRLRDRGFALTLATPKKPSQLGNLIREYRNRVDLAIVAGGDGALNAAADSLVETGVPLGILPLGTANDLARTLAIPVDLDGACDVIASGHTRRIDAGWINGKHFFNVASIGLSVAITERLTRDVKKRWGVLAYAIAAMQALWRSRPFYAEIRNGDSVRTAVTVQIAVGNGRFYGGGMTVAENAAIDDQQLDLYSLEVRHWWQLLGLLWALRTGCLADRSCVQTCSGQEIEIRTRKRRPVNTDGEITASTPALFRIVPSAVEVLAPPQAD